MFWLWNNLLTYPYPNTYFVLSCPTARVRAKPFLRLETFSPEKQQDDEDAQILSYCFLMFFVSSQPINIGP